MGGIFYLWFIPLALIAAALTGIFYLRLHRDWTCPRKSDLEKAQEMEREEGRTSQMERAEASGHH